MTSCYLIKAILGCILLIGVAGSGRCQDVHPANIPPSHTPSSQSYPKLIRTQGSGKYHEVRYAISDRSGNLWFCTTGEGVYRYDGHTFTQFTTKEGLGSNTVWTALEDKFGNIWLGTDSGLCCYDGRRVMQVPIKLSDNYFSALASSDISKKNTVWAMLEDKDGKIWTCTDEGVYCRKGSSFTRFPGHGDVINKDQVRLKNIGYILQDKAGNIWFGSGVAGGDGLCRYDGKTLTSFKPEGETWIRYIVEDKKGRIWFGTRSHGNWQYDGRQFVKYTVKTEIGAPMTVDKAGRIWFAGAENRDGYHGDGGIWRNDGNAYVNFTEKDGLGNYAVWCALEDRSGNMWIGTRNTGLYRYDGKKFTRFSD